MEKRRIFTNAPFHFRLLFLPKVTTYDSRTCFIYILIRVRAFGARLQTHLHNFRQQPRKRWKTVVYVQCTHAETRANIIDFFGCFVSFCMAKVCICYLDVSAVKPIACKSLHFATTETVIYHFTVCCLYTDTKYIGAYKQPMLRLESVFITNQNENHQQTVYHRRLSAVR